MNAEKQTVTIITQMLSTRAAKKAFLLSCHLLLELKL